MYKQLTKKLVALVVVSALLAMAVPLGFACAGTSPPEASFTAEPTSGPAPLEVQFTDQSTGGITDWEWDFDNDGTVDSTEQSPSYTYEAGGKYTVSLKATGPGGSDMEVKAQYIEVTNPPEADFTAEPTSGTFTLEVHFTDQSTGGITDWAWDFDNDGIVDSTEQNPSYTYEAPGKYTVSLKVSGPSGSDTEVKAQYIKVASLSPEADFTAHPTSGAPPLEVHFTDQSTGEITHWEWDLNNDGIVDSTEQNPSYTYEIGGKCTGSLKFIEPGYETEEIKVEYTWETRGKYTVSLKISGPGGSDTKVKAQYIQVAVPLEAGFTAEPTFGSVPLEVHFTDQSTGEITGWEWDFNNDGTVDSTEQNPSYTYGIGGEYTVSLKVTGPGGSDTATEVDYVEATTEVIITVGILADITGPTAVESIAIMNAIMDLARFINEEDAIPGVRLKLVTYDMRGDPARVVPGYEWLKEQGAKLIFSPLTMTGEILKAFAERDKVPLLIASSTEPLIEPPGWVFCFNSPVSYQIKALLQWISEEQWDYEAEGRPPKIGFVGWNEPFGIEQEQAMREYCLAYPDKFEYVGGFLAPVGTMVWAGEVEELKDCDYVAVPPFGIAAATFACEFRGRGYTATFIGLDTLSAYLGLLVDGCGWEALDGMLTAHSTLWWNEPAPLVDLTKELLYKYRPMEAEDIIYAGSGYLGGFQQAYLFFDILRAAIEEVGAENFDGQAFYDTAIEFKTTSYAYEGFPEWGFTQTIRYAAKHVAIYEWSAVEEDLVRVSDWIPLSALEAARTELHRAQTAVAACMADAGAATLSNWNNTTGWDGSPGVIQADGYDAADYLDATFNAYYEVQEDGEITGIGTSGESWPGVHWDDDIVNWVED